MSDDTPQNPAIAKLLRLPPAVLEEISENPESLTKLSRVQLALVQEKLTRQYLDNAEASVAQGTAVHEALRKVSNLEPRQAGGPAGGGFSITINIPTQTDDKSPAIDVTPTLVQEDET